MLRQPRLGSPLGRGFLFGRLSWRPLSFQNQNHINAIATQKMATPSTNNQPVV
jgi:hypothetical protein